MKNKRLIYFISLLVITICLYGVFLLVPIVYCKKGHNYEKSGDFDHALHCYTMAITLNEQILVPLPLYPTLAYSMRGTLYQEHNMYSEAIKDYTQAIRISALPALRLNSIFLRGCAYGMLKQYDNAIHDFSRMLEESPDNKLALAFRGQAYMDAGMQDKAMSDLDRALELDPQNYNAMCTRGVLFADQGETAKAIEEFKTVIKNADNDNWIKARAYRELGAAYMLDRDYSSAIDVFNDAILFLTDHTVGGDKRTKKELAFCHEFRGYCNNELNNYGAALEDIDMAAHLYPTQVDQLWYSCRGLALLGLEQYDKAVAELTRSIELDNDSAVRRIRGFAYYGTQMYDLALADVSEGISTDDDYSIKDADHAHGKFRTFFPEPFQSDTANTWGQIDALLKAEPEDKQ